MLSIEWSTDVWLFTSAILYIEVTSLVMNTFLIMDKRKYISKFIFNDNTFSNIRYISIVEQAKINYILISTKIIKFGDYILFFSEKFYISLEFNL